MGAIRNCAKRLPTRPLLLLDRGYVCLWLWCQLSTLALDVLCRLQEQSMFFISQPTPSEKKRTAPQRWGKIELDDLSTQNNPDRTYNVTDEKAILVTIRCGNRCMRKRHDGLTSRSFRSSDLMLPAKNAIPKSVGLSTLDKIHKKE